MGGSLADLTGYGGNDLGLVEVVFGKIIKNSELGFVDGGNEEYKNATNIIFNEIVKLGNFETLPPYNSENDKILKKNRKKRRK